MYKMPTRPQNKYKKRKYNKKNKINNKRNKPIKKCPFVIGSNEYHNWKRERYPSRTLVK